MSYTNKLQPYEEFPEFCKVIEGETPHGGVKLVIYFFDSAGKRCTEEDSTRCQILELDKNEDSIFSLISES